ncbi:DnaJ C-terminal domain-containing protein [Noviherbaspirillum galbum]|uniref:DnaJ domain-containing protein n=1 Tax=Noviherbaspirillum galbum TaxID=2709383 RepID=A0A6B3SS04_9BURK|nr:DnaJ C-terminal domain-containing protein [Noviherbaspirillum galbum]NEX63431.1 DnaJ domain-containing protein [Noviherbaspirillum galbum]
MSVSLDHYATMGIAETASAQDILQAYRRLAMKWHPDRHSGSENKAFAEAEFKKLQRAYAVLGDPNARAIYDLERQPVDPFEDMRRSHRAERPERDWRDHRPAGADAKWKVTITAQQAAEGCRVEYPRKYAEACSSCDGQGTTRSWCSKCHGRGYSGYSHCPRCSGQGSVFVDCANCDGDGKIHYEDLMAIRVPAGVIDGSEIVARRLGKPSRYGGHPGDLHITIKLKAEGGWKFSGLNITGSLKVPFSVAMFGGTVKVALPLGRVIDVDVPARTNSGRKIRLAGAGLRDQHGNRGDVVMTVAITLPSSRKKVPDYIEAAVRALYAGE